MSSTQGSGPQSELLPNFCQAEESLACLISARFQINVTSVASTLCGPGLRIAKRQERRVGFAVFVDRRRSICGKRNCFRRGQPNPTPVRPKDAKVYLRRKFHETPCEHLMAFDSSSTLRVRGRKNPGGPFRFDFRPHCQSTTAGREPHK
jgi:hypothetical protein